MFLDEEKTPWERGEKGKDGGKQERRDGEKLAELGGKRHRGRLGAAGEGVSTQGRGHRRT